MQSATVASPSCFLLLWTGGPRPGTEHGDAASIAGGRERDSALSGPCPGLGDVGLEGAVRHRLRTACPWCRTSCGRCCCTTRPTETSRWERR